MRFLMGLLAGVIAAGLVGCTTSNGSSGPGSSGPGSSGPGLSGPGLSGPGPSASTSPTGQAAAEPAAPAGPAEPETLAGAHAAAARFDGLQAGSQFAASWSLLAPAARQHVPQGVWVRVHSGCPSAGAGLTTEIKAITVFGNAAIVTETLTGAPKLGPAENIFDYVSGHWGFTPGNLSIYTHGSVAADIAAAKAAGLCAGWKSF